MSNSIETPRTASDRALQTIKPTELIDGSPAAISGVSDTTLNSVDGNAVYIFSTVSAHIKFSKESSPATVNDVPIPMQTPMVFSAGIDDHISFIKMAGQPDGTIWIMRVEET